MIKKYIFPFGKLKYLTGKKPKVDCILCSSIKKNPEVKCLIVGETKHITASVNLYPYNTGHLMLFPKRHLTDLRQMSDEEAFEMHKATTLLIEILERLYSTEGFTVGFNLGSHSGASIDHIHRHIIPRYPNELGVIDLVGGAKVIVEDPHITQKRIQQELQKSDLFL